MHRNLTIVLLAASAVLPGQIRKVSSEMDAIVPAGAKIEKLSGGFISTGWEQGIAFLILIAVLVVRPQGLMGRRVRRA